MNRTFQCFEARPIAVSSHVDVATFELVIKFLTLLYQQPYRRNQGIRTTFRSSCKRNFLSLNIIQSSSIAPFQHPFTTFPVAHFFKGGYAAPAASQLMR